MQHPSSCGPSSTGSSTARRSPEERELLPAGKLALARLSPLLAQYGARSDRVLVGPAAGEDAAAVLTRQPCIVVANDPVTFATDRIGWYVVHVNANDIATRGAEPLWFVLTLLVPPDQVSGDDVAEIFRQVAAACASVGAELIGGHTEVTPSVRNVVAVGTMIGEVAPQALVATRGARVGDAVLQMGPLAVEGTALLARERASLLQERGLDGETVERCRSLLDHPGISVLPYARLARQEVALHAMHDPTEGGVASCLHEMAEAAGVGLEIQAERVTWLDETQLVCRALGLDPWGLLASGSLVLTCADAEARGLLEACRDQECPAARIGTVVEARLGVHRLWEDGRREALPRYEVDEIVRALEERPLG